MKKNLISVIVPAYKSEKTIESCLRSIISQTYNNLEIIVVLKDSGDKTESIIKKLKDKRITVIKQTNNSGPGGARNIGVEHAHGNWIGFVEADDNIAPDFYNTLISAATDESIDIVCGEIVVNDFLWTSYKTHEIRTGFDEKYKLIKNGATFDKIFRKKLIDKFNIRCSEKIRWEDNIFIFRAFYYARKIKPIPHATYFYNATEWSEEYKTILQHDVVLEATEVVRFLKSIDLTYSQRKLAYKKVIASFVNEFLTVPEIYKSIKQLMDSPFFLVKRHWKLRFRNFKRRVKQRIKHQFKKKG